jgi:FdhD protein
VTSSGDTPRVVGVLIGGAATRMGGAPKGLLRAPSGERIVERTISLFAAAGVPAVLLGGPARARDYAELGVPALDDECDAEGPLAGLLALLRRSGAARVFLVGGDMPYLTPEIVARLVASDADAIAPRVDDRWEPLFSAFSVADVQTRADAAVRAGTRSTSALLDALDARALSLSAPEARALRDWDAPEDLALGAARVIRVKSGHATHHEDSVAIEEPLEIRIKRDKHLEPPRPITITMRTPGNDAELAVGFLVSEGVVRASTDVVRTEKPTPSSTTVTLSALVPPPSALLERSFFTTSSCGVCGKGSLEALEALAPPPLVDRALSVSADYLSKLPSALLASQLLFDRTGGIHATALFDASDPSARPILVREDVGRHNAFDKVVGAALAANLLPLSRHVALVSGRASFELVQKALMAGIPILCAIGAPSSLAVDLAQRFGMTLVGFLREERLNVYAGEHRIEGIARASAAGRA